jgi:hypothetical protein
MKHQKTLDLIEATKKILSNQNLMTLRQTYEYYATKNDKLINKRKIIKLAILI